MLDVEQLPEAVRDALRKPHENELPTSTYAASDPQDGALK